MDNYQELNLSGYESRAYEALVRFGKGTAAQVSANAGVPYGKIYPVLNSLIQKSLVRLLPQKTKTFAPADPEALLRFLDEKQKRLDQAKARALELKKQYQSDIKEPVLLSQGMRNFDTLAREMQPAKTFEYSIRYVAEPKPRWIQEYGVKIKRGVDVKNLSAYTESNKKNVRTWLRATKAEWRKLENEGVAISVKESEVLLGLIKSNTTVLIRDAAFAGVMKQLFLESWKHAPRIDPSTNP